MAFDSSRLPYICQNCLRHRHCRPQALQPPSSSFAKQWQARSVRTKQRITSEWKKRQMMGEKEVDEIHAFRKILGWKQMLNGNHPLTMAERYKLFVTYRVKNVEKLWDFHEKILGMEKKLSRPVPTLKESPVLSENDRIMDEEMKSYKRRGTEVWRFIHNPSPPGEALDKFEALKKESLKKRISMIQKRIRALKKNRNNKIEPPKEPDPKTEKLTVYDPLLPEDLENFNISTPVALGGHKIMRHYVPARRDEPDRQHDPKQKDNLIQQNVEIPESELRKQLEHIQKNKVTKLLELERKYKPVQQQRHGTAVISKPFRRARRTVVGPFAARRVTTQPVRTAFSTMVKVDKTAGHSWYWETYAPSFIQKAQANIFFTQQAAPKFLTSVARFREFPSSDLPEVAFVGRSNVGKSSLLNTLVDSKLLARTSATRGFTKTMNLYGIAPKGNIHIEKTEKGHEHITGAGGLTIVDMPGYGEGSLTEWGVQIMKYIESRKQLRRVFVLIDALHGLKEKDISLLTSLRLAGISHQIILSKLDRVYIPAATSIKSRDGRSLKRKGSQKELELAVAGIREEIKPVHGFGALGELIGVSSEVLVDGKPLGIDALRFAVLQAAGVKVGKKSKIVTTNIVRAIETPIVRKVKMETK